MGINVRPKNPWGSNAVQFPRLLAEICANVVLTLGQRDDICKSMDITWEQLDELFDRAQVEWERVKLIVCPVQS